MDSPILLLVLSIIGLAAAVIAARSFVYLLKQPVPPRDRQRVSGRRIVMIVTLSIAAIAAVAWFQLVLEPPLVVSRLFSIGLMLLVALQLKRMGDKRRATGGAEQDSANHRN
jgi:hypothetical protein